jgi:hypothetical protein
VNGGGHGHDFFLDLRCQSQHAHDLGYPGTGDSLLAGDIRLSGNLTGFQEGLSLDGLA